MEHSPWQGKLLNKAIGTIGTNPVNSIVCIKSLKFLEDFDDILSLHVFKDQYI
jgi:hypothetical protein